MLVTFAEILLDFTSEPGFLLFMSFVTHLRPVTVNRNCINSQGASVPDLVSKVMLLQGAEQDRLSRGRMQRQTFCWRGLSGCVLRRLTLGTPGSLVPLHAQV